MIGANLSEPNMDVKSSLNVCNGSVAKPNPQKGGGVMSSEYGSYKYPLSDLRSKNWRSRPVNRALYELQVSS